MNEIINRTPKQVQYNHYNNQKFNRGVYKQYSPSYTAALEVPTKDELIFMMHYRHMEKALRLSMKLGITKVNPSDVYIKKIGREISSSRLETFEFDLQEIRFDEKRTIFRFSNKNNTIVELQIHQNSKRVYFMNCLI